MRSLLSILYAATALTGSTSAFHAPLSLSHTSSTRECISSSPSQLQMAVATEEFFQRNVVTSSSSGGVVGAARTQRRRTTRDGEPAPLPRMSAEEWMSHIQTSSEIDHIRQELIGRYSRNGFDRKYATKQVEEFLLDPAQSVPFLEMRRAALDSKRGVYGDDGLTGDLTLVISAAVMVFGTVGVHMLNLYSDYLVSAGHS